MSFLALTFLALDRAPSRVGRVVSLLLKRDPSERITADIAVTMLALVLWAPPAWMKGKHVTIVAIHR